MPDQLSWLPGLAEALFWIAVSLSSVSKSLQAFLRIIDSILVVRGRMSSASKGRCKREHLPRTVAATMPRKRTRKAKATCSPTSPTSRDE